MCGFQDWPDYQCQLGFVAVSRGTFFKMADNTVSDSDSRWEERADEGPINPVDEAKRLEANLDTPEEAKIARERKVQTNQAGKTSIKLEVQTSNKIATFRQLFRISATFR